MRKRQSENMTKKTSKKTRVSRAYRAAPEERLDAAGLQGEGGIAVCTDGSWVVRLQGDRRQVEVGGEQDGGAACPLCPLHRVLAVQAARCRCVVPARQRQLALLRGRGGQSHQCKVSVPALCIFLRVLRPPLTVLCPPLTALHPAACPTYIAPCQN